MKRKVIQIDLDGVLNDYCGIYDSNEIPKIKEGAFEFVKKLSEEYSLELFTVRDNVLSEKWLEKNGLLGFFQKITNVKNPYASVFIDDRAINFNGNYAEIYNQIKYFKPYWKK